MGFLEFFASIVKSCAWPFAVGFVVYLFRKEIKPLLPYARLRLKHNDTEVDVRLDMAKETAEQLHQSKSLPPPTKEETDRFNQVASVSPKAAILESWLQVEEALMSLAETAGLQSERRRSPLFQMRWLRSNEIIDPPTASVLDDLRSVRNRVVHDLAFEPSMSEAMGFRDLAEQVIAALAVEQERLQDKRDERV
jgi:hypothetical protein